jgi:hypothetical protein
VANWHVLFLKILKIRKSKESFSTRFFVTYRMSFYVRKLHFGPLENWF